MVQSVRNVANCEGLLGFHNLIRLPRLSYYHLFGRCVFRHEKENSRTFSLTKRSLFTLAIG